MEIAKGQMKRAERRQAEQNKKAKVKRFIKENWCMRSSGYSNKLKNEMLGPKFVGKVASAPKSCSCSRCANPRKLYKGTDKLTIGERRHEL